MSTPRARGASSGAKRRAGAHEAQHHRIPPALRNRDAHDGGGQEPSSLSTEFPPAPRNRDAHDGGGQEPSSSPVPYCFLDLGNDLIFHAMEYLNAESLAKLETVAKAFKRIAIPHWKNLDKQVPVGCRSSSSVPRTRAIRFHLASTLAHSALKDPQIQYGSVDIDKEKRAQRENHKPTFEYFVRFVDLKTDQVLAQGFTKGLFNGETMSAYYNHLLQLPLDKLDLSTWPALHALMPMENLSSNVFQGVSIAIVAVRRNKKDPPCLLLAFASDEYLGRWGSVYLGERGAYSHMPPNRKNCDGVYCSILVKGCGSTRRFLASESSLTLCLSNGWRLGNF